MALNPTVYSKQEFEDKFKSYGRFEEDVHVKSHELVIEGNGTQNLPKALRVTKVDGAQSGGNLTIRRVLSCFMPTWGLNVDGVLHIQKWHGPKLPAIFARELKLEKCQGIETLVGEVLQVKSLTIDNCDKLKLPQVFSGNLTLNKYKHDLPDNFRVKGDLTIKHSKRLKKLPEGLKVTGNLFLEDFETFPAMAKKMTVKGKVYYGVKLGDSLYPNESTKEQLQRAFSNLNVN